jgi:hypothetical protein
MILDIKNAVDNILLKKIKCFFYTVTMAEDEVHVYYAKYLRETKHFKNLLKLCA